LNQFKSHIEPVDNKEPVSRSAPVNPAADEVLKKASDFSFFIEKEKLGKILPPIFLTVIVMIVYISLSHFHVKSLKQKEELKTELNELRSEYISVKSNLMKQSNQSEVAKRLETEGIKELRTPPSIIEARKK
jgi:hypothetical protein